MFIESFNRDSLKGKDKQNDSHQQTIIIIHVTKKRQLNSIAQLVHSLSERENQKFITRSKLNLLTSVFFADIVILLAQYDSKIKKWCHSQKL